MTVGNHSSGAERLRVVCDYYLDLGGGLREQSGKTAIWPCPACGRPSFVAAFDQGRAGCTEERCEVPSSMGLLELVAYLDEDLRVGDERGASEKFREILDAAVRVEQERKAGLEEEKRRAREERYWQKGLTRARAREAGERGWPEQRLFSTRKKTPEDGCGELTPRRLAKTYELHRYKLGSSHLLRSHRDLHPRP